VSRVVFRIDDRLIHGQVVEGWVRNLGLTRIIIVSDRISGDSSYRRLLEFSVPTGVRVDVFSLEEASEKFRGGELGVEDTIVLFESPREVIDLIDYGIEIDEINVGCMHYDGRNRKLKRNVAVSEEDIRDFKEISSMGAAIECRSLPQDKRVDLMELVNRIK